MGSEIIEVLTEQKGNLETNPDGIVPEVSRPIEQLAVPFDTNSSTTKPIQQRLLIKTKPDGHTDGEYSHPVTQVGEFKSSSDFPDTDADHLLVQNLLVTGNHTNSLLEPKAKTPIQQVVFVSPDSSRLDAQITSTRPIQQFNTRTSGDSISRPVEQVDEVQTSINVTQFDFVELIFPPCNSTKNAVDSNILWRINDFGFTFDLESIIFIVKGVQVQERSGFVLTLLPAGLQIFYDPPEDFGFEEEVVVILTIDDTAVPPNSFYLRCAWSTVPDVRPPFFRNVTPACNSTAVDSFAPISFDVLDFGEGVDGDSVRLSVEGVTVCSGITLVQLTSQDFTTISGIPVGATVTGYHVTYVHPNVPWRYGSNVTISMEAQDLSPLKNKALFICAFDVEESQAPIFVNPIPEPCDSFVDNRTGLSFEVYGVEHGVDITTLEVRVDNKLRKVFVRPRILRAE